MNMFVGMWGEIAGILAALSIALSSLQVRALGDGYHPVAINAIRCSLAAIGFALLWWFGSRAAGDWLHAFPLLLTAVVCGLVVGDSIYFSAIARIGAGRATPIAMSYPLPTAALAAILFGEQLSLLKLLGIFIGVMAIWIIAARSRDRGKLVKIDRGYWIGVALAVLASLCWSVSVLALRPALALVPLDFANVMRMALAGLILPAFGHSAITSMSVPTGRFRFGVLIAGLSATAITTSYFLTASIHQSGAAIGSILSSMAPVFAAPMAWLIFKEEVTPRTMVAIGLGMLGIALVVLN